MGEGRAWVEQAKRMLAYGQEAAEFLGRARKRFPASSSEHAPLVTLLWFKAEEADPLVHQLLEELNDGLLSGGGKVEVNRGACIRVLLPNQGIQQAPTPLSDWPGFTSAGVPFLRAQGGLFPMARESLVYNCTWTLSWGADRGVTVDLGATAEGGELLLRVYGERAQHTRELAYPPAEEALKDALVQTFVAEESGEPPETKRQRQGPDASSPGAPRQRGSGVRNGRKRRNKA